MTVFDLEWAIQELLFGFAVFLRIGGIFLGFPIFGETVLPLRIRLVCALCFTALAAPMLERPPLGISVFALEVAVGLALGLLMRGALYALSTAGSIIGNATSLAQMFGAVASEEQQSVLGRILYWSVIALLAFSPIATFFLEAILATYDALPMGTTVVSSDLSVLAATAADASFELAFEMAAPFLVIAFIYNLFLGVISRAMPQLLVTMIGAPAITAASIFLLLLAIPTLFEVWRSSLFETYLALDFK